MKLVTYDDGRVGELVDGQVFELDVPDMRRYFELGGEVKRTGRATPLEEVTLRAPIIPKKFFHTAGNFREHHEESERVNWSHPVLSWIVFFQNVDAIIGPDEPIVYPELMTSELDYELELAVVIGKAGKFFSPEEAEDYIAGYIVFNDITARDIQREEMKSGVFCLSKSIDTFVPIGPWIVTPDEVGDPHELSMELRVNGERRQRSHMSRMSVTVPEIISHYSAMGYTPSVEGKRPVMVWLHGGGFAIGHAGASLYHGAQLAAKADAVVVTVNYRLGSLGWLAHPGLAACSGESFCSRRPSAI